MKKILLVEDEESIRNLFVRVLENAEYTVFAFDTLAKCRSCLATTDIDLAILDGNLPDGNGLVLAEELAEAGIPVLFVSGDMELSPKAEAAGVVALRKPIVSYVLTARVRQMLENLTLKIVIAGTSHTSEIRRTLEQCGVTVWVVRDWVELREALRHEPDLYLMGVTEGDATPINLKEAAKLQEYGRRVIWIDEQPGPEGVEHLPGKQQLHKIVQALSTITPPPSTEQ